MPRECAARSKTAGKLGLREVDGAERVERSSEVCLIILSDIVAGDFLCGDVVLTLDLIAWAACFDKLSVDPADESSRLAGKARELADAAPAVRREEEEAEGASR